MSDPPTKRGPPPIPPAETQRVIVGDPNGVKRIVRGASFGAPPNSPPEIEGQESPRSQAQIGDYHLVGRFPSSAATLVFLAYKSSPYGFIRRAVVKWAGRRGGQFEVSRSIVLDEARAIAFLDHPNLVKILDVGEDAGGAYLAIEYVPGPDLRRVAVELMKREHRMPVELAAYIAIEVLRGLDHAHSALGPELEPLNIVHRDVNPSNVILSNDGHVKLTDFGMVHMKGRMQMPTAPHIVKGKYRYLAPEYISEQTLTLHADIYGVGVMLFELLANELCFPTDEPVTVMTQIVQDGPPYRVLDQVDVPKELKKIVRIATDRRPERRFATAKEMYLAIEDVLRSKKLYVSPTTLADFLKSEGLPQR